MKYLLILLACLPVFAETLQQKLDALSAAPNVLEARTVRGPASVPGFGNVYTAQVLWFYTENGVAKKSSAEVIITSLGLVGSEAAYWLSEIPAPLRPVVPITFLGAKAFTLAQVETFVNAKWVAANATANPIQDFTATSIDAKTVEVAGLFDVAGTRERRTYRIWLVDPAGNISGANAKFERVLP
jgi:hypothetical protein